MSNIIYIYDPEQHQTYTSKYERQYFSQKKSLDILDACLETGLIRLMSSFGNLEENNVISPSTLLYALILLSRITGNESRDEINKAIGLTQVDISLAADAVWKGITAIGDISVCEMGNSFWIDDKYNVDSDMLKTVCKDFRASAFSGEMGSDNLNEIMREWLNIQTRDVLSESVENYKTEPSTVFQLISTVYFRSGWVEKFNSQRTTIGCFSISKKQKVACKFMSCALNTTFYEGKQYTAVAKELNGGYDVIFILPEIDSSVADLLSSEELYRLIFHNISASKKYCCVKMKVPALDITKETDLKNGLKKIGIKHIFAPDKADFSEITRESELYLSNVNHISGIRIDEKGVEGASYVDMEVALRGLPSKLNERDFVLDRPFIFAVTKENIPIFFGTVYDPSK